MYRGHFGKLLLLEQLYSDQQKCYSSQTLDTIMAPSCLGGSDSGWDSYLVSSRNIILARRWTCPNLPPVEVKVIVDETVVK
ncbi:hypothetical protein DPMN_188590 [Dreissena polymorpha]|uniref:Uncharacterized protein n=1 Tax=Dreissena polymorpha TaxID=45954 RepID=A0A9D4DTP9_DREPO|nr:hypothetical protein DPMN_188590 [Dreissena polymorpha]